MTQTLFSSPVELQDAIIVCLAAAFDPVEWDNMQFHKGAVGTGHALDCCTTGSVLRVETDDLVPNDERGRRWLARPNGCVDLDQTIVVTYKRCFNSVTKQGKIKTAAALQEQGASLTASAWAAVQAMACCDEYLIRFVSMVPDKSLETCAGWTLTVDATLKVCAGECAPAPAPSE